MTSPRTALLVLLAFAWAGDAGARDARDWLREALDVACRHPTADGAELAAALPGATPAGGELMRAQGMPVGWRRTFDLPDGAGLRLERIQPGGRLRRLSAEYHEPVAGDTVPRLAAVADGACVIVAARRLLYDDGAGHAPTAIEHLDGRFEPTGVVEPLNPPVPPGDDPGGIPVALVDAGVNYLLPEIGRRLARTGNGEVLGYDFWDTDERPFDANPAGSPFFPQRHGTKTASLLLREAPAARLVPYRYPRPDMSRMGELVRHAGSRGVDIVNLSLGSNHRDDWGTFAEAARAAPHMLFVVSAGNDGRDIDAVPVYPAALDLDNMITVTSAEHTGAPARGSNLGKRSVDLLVPAEGVRVTGFDGRETLAYGSSYAAVRVSALAARLLAENPGWRAAELKRAIVERALPAPPGSTETVAHGFLPRPEQAERVGPIELDEAIREIDRRVVAPEASADPPAQQFDLALTFAVLESTRWQLGDVERHGRQAARILARCGIRVSRIDVRVLDGGDQYRYFRDDTAAAMLSRVEIPRPAVFFVRHTLQEIAFEAEAVGRGNNAGREALTDTVWIIEDARDPGIIIAHELVHLLVDDGRHTDLPNNLMREETAPGNTRLTDAQCEEIIRTGTANGLLIPAADEQERDGHGF